MGTTTRRASAKLATIEKYYSSASASWDIGRPQRSIRRLVESNALTSPVLDIGCGTGDHASLLAQKGYSVTGVDLSPTAIQAARQKTARHSDIVTLIEADFLRWRPEGNTRFSSAIDVGMFHCLGDADAKKYVKHLAQCLKPGAKLYLVCLAESPHEEASWPHHYDADELKALFDGNGWRVASIERTADESTFSDDGFAAWMMTAERA